MCVSFFANAFRWDEKANLTLAPERDQVNRKAN